MVRTRIKDSITLNIEINLGNSQEGEVNHITLGVVGE